jgi:hypothetical protein
VRGETDRDAEPNLSSGRSAATASWLRLNARALGEGFASRTVPDAFLGAKIKWHAFKVTGVARRPEMKSFDMSLLDQHNSELIVFNWLAVSDGKCSGPAPG